MKYSFNLDKSKFVFAQRYNVNASYKKLGAICDYVRYMPAGAALYALEDVMRMFKPVPFRRHNARMGSRHELGGKKGAYPIKAAKEVQKAIVNAIANANAKGLDGESMYIIHSCANKTIIMRRGPSRGSAGWGRGQYGRSASVHSDLEYAKIEIALAVGDEKELTKNMKYFIKKKGQYVHKSKASKMETKEAPKKKQKAAKPKDKAKEPAKVKA